MDTGNGADGALNITSGTFNLHTGTQQGGRTCGDAVIHRVASVTANSVTLTSTPASGCFAAGDEVMLISLQGRRGPVRVANVGNYETLRLMSASGTSLVFTTNKTLFYGDMAGSDAGASGTEQRVFVQRVPNYTSVTVSGGATLTGNAWGTAGGGVLFFRATGSVTIQGQVTATALGYAGGQSAPLSNGYQGESRCGVIFTSDASACNSGGGVGGTVCLSTNHPMPGGGGALHQAGGAVTAQPCPQAVSIPYAAAGRLLLGSGGGAGKRSGDDSVVAGPGGHGGGAVVIHAASIGITGSVSARGSDGTSANACGECTMAVATGGGGGAGGTVILASTSVTGSTNVDVRGGAGGGSCAACSANGGGGGDGSLQMP